MSKSLLTLLCGFVLSLCCRAQTGSGEVLSHYIFDSFSKGTVRLLSGSVHEEELNYNSLTAEMVFNDNGKYQAIANWKDVDTVTIQNRQFVPGEKGFYEVLVRGTIPLYAEYTCSIKDPGADIGYGMSSTTSAATSLKSLIQSGGAYNLKLPEGYQIIAQHNYLTRRDGKFRSVNTVRQLSAVFPEKKSWIGAYIKDRKPDLSRKEDLAALVQGLNDIK